MPAARRDVGSLECPLQAGPKVLNRVRVNAASDVLNRVVHERMTVRIAQDAIGAQRVRIDRRTRLDVRADDRSERPRLVIGNDHRAHLGRFAALNHAEHRRLAERRAARFDSAVTAHFVKVALAADEGFVRFDLAREGRFEGLVFHGQAQAVHHKPGRLLRDAQGARDLAGRDAVAAPGEHPHRDHPLVEANRGILKDGPDLDRGLFAAILTLPQAPLPHEGDGSRTATHTRAHGAFRPAHLGHEIVGNVGGKVAGRFLKGGGSRVGLDRPLWHVSSIQDKGLRSQVYNLGPGQ